MFMYLLDIQADEESNSLTFEQILKGIFGTVNITLCLYFLREEWKQMKNLGTKYLDFWNSVNCLQIGLTIVTIILSFTEAMDPVVVHTMAAISLLTIYLNLFYMVRMHEELAWFNTLF